MTRDTATRSPMTRTIRLPPTMHFLERDWLSSNGVLFDDGRHTALVDTGYHKHRELTVALVRHLLGGRPLDLIVNTHLHSDHCGGNAILQRTFGSRTVIPAASATAVRDWGDGLTHQATGQRCERFGFDDVLEDGQEIVLGGLRWRAIAAPGHDPESLVFHCPDARILISADALWENGFGVIFPELEGDSGFAEQRAILERIATLEVDVAIPGHGPMFTDVAGALARAHSRLDHLSADPARNARHATKVLLKFLLLEHERVPLEQVPTLMATIELTANANRRYLGMDPRTLADWSVAELLRAGAARVEDGVLLNA
jgi:glyoxylase-like metal-dependent hydrolase (beta-lactamase superfamily II)